MHSIRTDFGFNLLRSASKLKRGVIEKKWWVLLVFRIREFSFLQYFCCVFFAIKRDGDIVRESFSVIFILHSLWYTPLVYVFMNLFFQCDLLCLYFVVFFSLNQMSILHELLDKIDTTSEYVEMVNKYLINYIELHIFV